MSKAVAVTQENLHMFPIGTKVKFRGTTFEDVLFLVVDYDKLKTGMTLLVESECGLSFNISGFVSRSKGPILYVEKGLEDN
jgi:hypothetical protein